MFIRSGPVTIQPSDARVINTFGVVDTERIQMVYECQEGCSQCCGPSTVIALTDSRIVMRKERPAAGCCSSRPHLDTAIMLEDIQILREATVQQSCNCISLCLSCITCSCCCGDKPKFLQTALAAGIENLTFKITDVPEAALHLSRAIIAAKSNKSRH